MALPAPSTSPTIAFLTVAGGGPGGATIRDARLARALRRRGYRVTVYWLLGSNGDSLGPGIPNRRLCSGVRFLTRRPLPVSDFLLRHLDPRGEARRHRSEQQLPRLQERALANLCDVLAKPGTGDPGLVRRLERLLLRDRVTHLLAGMGLLAGLTEAVAARGRHPFRTHITIQGDDLFLHYARDAAARARATARLAELVRGAEIPAVAVSRAYAQEMEELLGLPRGQLGVLHPGLELAPEAAPAAARATVAALLPGFDPARPLVTFLGRTDSEKGVDLLLYALRILQARGLRPRIAIAGIPSFGADYEQACRRMARQMELPAEFIGPVSEPQRDALFVCSRCVVYPAIHTESFGMVAAEALAQGTPAVVPRRGGLVEAVSDGESAGGLLFEPWDSADLARQIETLLTDAALHARLAAAAPGLARRFDIEAIADRLLGQLGLPRRSDAASP